MIQRQSNGQSFPCFPQAQLLLSFHMNAQKTGSRMFRSYAYGSRQRHHCPRESLRCNQDKYAGRCGSCKNISQKLRRCKINKKGEALCLTFLDHNTNPRSFFSLTFFLDIFHNISKILHEIPFKDHIFCDLFVSEYFL